MFEKEADEYGEKDLGGKYLSSVVAKDKLHAYKLGQYDGFIAGAEFGYNKANEWHYVKDGLPKELHDVLCFVIHNEHRFVLQGYLRDRRWVLSPLGTYLNNDDVIAWKKIVLPELKGE